MLQKADFALLSLWPPFWLIVWIKVKNISDGLSFQMTHLPSSSDFPQEANISG